MLQPLRRGLALAFLTFAALAPAAAAGPQLVSPLAIEGQAREPAPTSLLAGGSTLLVARALDEAGASLPGQRVLFTLVAPVYSELGDALTDSSGRASLSYRPRAPAGRHVVIAEIRGAAGSGARLVYPLRVHERGWLWVLLFGLAGGLGLFLFGMDLMSASLQRSAGRRLRAVLGALTKNRILGLAVGAFVTVLIQSSSATTVLLVSFVRAGLISFQQSLGVILGADIGTTVTAQLIAFRITHYALLMIALGFGLRTLARRSGWRHAGEVMLGVGLLFFGMHVMAESMAPLRDHRAFLAVLRTLEDPVAGIVVGTLLTALIHSSAAFLGLLIVLAQQGLISLEAGIPLMFGANIGTCVTAYLASLRAGRAAKRVALAHTAFKVLGVLIVVGWIPAFADLVRSISPQPSADAQAAGLAADVPRQIANAHSVFNVGLALLFLPFTGLCARGLLWLLPERPEQLPERLRARHLEPSVLNTPALALSLAKVEILSLGRLVKHMTETVIEPLCGRNLEVLETLDEEEHRVDALDEQITAYLLEIGRRNLSPEQTEEVYLMLHVTKLFELSSDVIHRELRPLARHKLETGLAFSPAGEAQVRTYHLKVVKQLSRALDAFGESSLTKAENMTRKQAKYVALEESFRRAHFERVRHDVTDAVASSEIHIAVMDALRKLNSHSTDIARAMLTRYRTQSAPPAPPAAGES